ncbi:hypothetical protein [Nocardioides sp.]|uniref:hypothetical protein n=1 Tax=Nocardioides sp. TaxID=35761 RepID=UPI00260A5138|nr:hypothetical protein [Nocardioides sp.]
MIATLGLGLLGIAASLAHERDVRAEALRPILAEPGQQGRLLVSFEGFATVNDHSIMVISIWPSTPDAPLPRGVAQWPAPGQAVLSAAAAETLGSSGRARFGEPSGQIAATGLETPDERRVYVRTTAAAFDATQMRPALGFGPSETVSDGWHGLSVLNAVTPAELIELLLACLVVPGAVALVAACGIGSEQRARRDLTLRVLGASRLRIFGLRLVEVVPAALVGAAVAAVGLLVLQRIGFSSGWLNFSMAGVDVGAGWERISSRLLWVPIIVVIAVAASGLRPSRIATVLPWKARDRAPIAALIGLLGGLVAVVVPAQSHTAQVRTLAYVVGVAIFMLFAPSLVAVLLGALGRAIAWTSVRTVAPGSLIGGRRLGQLPGRTARMTAGLLIGIVLLGQVQLWVSSMSVQYRGAAELQREVAGRVLQADPLGGGDALARHLERLPNDVVAVWVGHDERGGAVLEATCPALNALRLSCDATTLEADRTQQRSDVLWPVAQIYGIAPGSAVRPLAAGTTPKGLDGVGLALVSVDGHRIDASAVQQGLYADVPGFIHVSEVGDSWVSGAWQPILKGRWITLYSALGIGVLMFVAANVVAADSRDGSRTLGPLHLLSRGRRWLTGLVAVQVALPLVIATAVGVVGYWVLAAGMKTGDQYFVPSASFATVLLVMGVVIGVLVASASAVILTRALERWVPGRD